MDEPSRLSFFAVGDNPARVFGLGAKARACRLAGNAGFECVDELPSTGGVLLANLDYAWDPAWLKLLGSRQDSVLLHDREPVLAHVRGGDPADAMRKAMLGEGRSPEGLQVIDSESAEITNDELRKRERPFVIRLHPETAGQVERAAYDASYKGVTDALTLYLWRKPAFHLTRWAAEMDISPNAVTGIGAVLCLLAFFYFWFGNYWLGILAGFIFMVLDTVDGKLARLTDSGTAGGASQAFTWISPNEPPNALCPPVIVGLCRSSS